MSIFLKIKHQFIETLGLIILTGDFKAKSQYQMGWLDGYSKAWTEITGKSKSELVKLANESIKGSGKVLEQ